MKFSVKIKGRNYKFNPKSIMVDENGAKLLHYKEGLWPAIYNI